MTIIAVKELSLIWNIEGDNSVCVFYFISGTLYLAASLLLFFDFLDLKIAFVKNKIWVLLFLLGFLFDVSGRLLEAIFQTYFG